MMCHTWSLYWKNEHSSWATITLTIDGTEVVSWYDGTGEGGHSASGTIDLIPYI